jgi:hypothetical protein
MPTINNYTFSDVTYVIEENADIANAVGASFATLTISPASGFTIDANDFSIDPSFFPNTYVSSVTFAQSGVNVVCTINFAAGVTMPSSNVNIPLCVVGQGVVNEITIAGTFTANVGTNVTGDSTETNTPYSNSGAFGQSELLFSKTYTAAANHYLDVGAGMQIVQGVQSNYNIIQTPTYDSENRLTSITYDVNYIYPNQSISGDKIAIRLIKAVEIFTIANPKVKRWCWYVSGTGCYKTDRNIESVGRTQIWRVWGDEGAVFSVVLTDDNSETGPNTWNLATNTSIPSSGYVDVEVVFPDIQNLSLDVVRYFLTISGADVDINNTVEYFNQYNAAPRMIFNGLSSQGMTGFTQVEYQGDALNNYTTPVKVPVEWNITAPSGSKIGLSYPYLEEDREVYPLIPEMQKTIASTTLASTGSTITLSSTDGIAAGDRFNAYDASSIKEQAVSLAPFNYEVTSVDSSTQISVSPNVSVANDVDILFVKNNGTNIEFELTSVEVTGTSTATIKGFVDVYSIGDLTTNFTIDIDQFLYVIPSISCAATSSSGGYDIVDYDIPLDPAGGLVAFLVDAQGVPDKFEIYHGSATTGDKVATTSHVIPGSGTSNDGPFDSIFGTYNTGNKLPSATEAAGVDQFIGTNITSPWTYTRQSEFNTATGYTVSSMTVGSNTYQQILWWQYSAADYNDKDFATLRVTGSTGTAWSVLRLCCPDANCT